MNEITVTLPDGSSRRVPAGTTPGGIAAEISPRLAKAALAAIVDERLVDLTFPLDRDARVRLLTQDSPEALAIYRHSTAHLLAAAVTALFPDAQCGIGRTGIARSQWRGSRQPRWPRTRWHTST
jgi:threonyl-tRNA synthetase